MNAALPSADAARQVDRAPAPPRDLDDVARYFDSTDAGELAWEEADDAQIERPELEQISLRLPKADLAALRHRAARAGVGYTTLVRMIVRHYLRTPVSG